jgi:hypothetical protein
MTTPNVPKAARIRSPWWQRVLPWGVTLALLGWGRTPSVGIYPPERTREMGLRSGSPGAWAPQGAGSSRRASFQAAGSSAAMSACVRHHERGCI